MGSVRLIGNRIKLNSREGDKKEKRKKEEVKNYNKIKESKRRHLQKKYPEYLFHPGTYSSKLLVFSIPNSHLKTYQLNFIFQPGIAF